MNNLEREYRDCIKSRRDKIGITRHIMMHQVLYNVSPSSLGNCTIYSTWWIMICLVIPILSLLLFIQSFLNCNFFSFTCLLSFFLLLLVILTSDIIPTTIGTRLMKQLYFPGVKPIKLHCSTARASTSTCTYIYTYIIG